MSLRAMALAFAWAPLAAAAELPIFDAHLHYSHDAWDRLPPAEAVALLRKAGVKRALVSSSGGKVDAEWRKVFLEFPGRFMVGTDSFTPER